MDRATRQASFAADLIPWFGVKQMAHGRFFLYSAATALLALAILLPTAETMVLQHLSAGPVVASSIEISLSPHRPEALNLQLAAMREIHQKLRTAPSPKAREIIVAGSADVMSRGVVMMREMRSSLPTNAIGAFVSETITEAQAEDVRDFLCLMSLLIEMKGDQEDYGQAAESPHTRESAPIGTKVRSTLGVAHVPHLA